MKSKTKTVITTAAWQRTIFRRNSQPIIAWCEQCAAEVLMISVYEASRISDATPRTIYRQIENGDLHFTETETGELLICSDSL